jgi:hypothetical protein
MPRPGSERSEAVRIRVSSLAWAHFEHLRDKVRRDNPEAEVLAGDSGTRQVLSVWIEEQIRQAFVEP